MMFMMLLYTLLFATAGYAFAFHPYYFQQQHSYRIGNILHQQDYFHHRRPLVQLSYASTDPSIIEHNRKYLSNTLGFSKEKLDTVAIESRRGNILTREIGILGDRVNWLKNRLSLTENQIKKIIQSQPNILGMKDDRLESKIDYLQNRLLFDDILLRKVILAAPAILTFSTDNIEYKLVWLQERFILDRKDLSNMNYAPQY